MTFLKQKVKTEESIYGNWIFRSNEVNISIKITNREVTLITKPNGESPKEEKFDVNNEWFNEQFLFLSGDRNYYIKFANEEKMIFGKIEALTLNKIIWEFDFLRVKISN